MSTNFAKSGPSHPLALAMTALLLLNDHVFKAAWPGLLTGKLSDIAFLVVCPVVVAAGLAHLRVSDRRARLVALWTVGTFFVALQLWPPLGDTLASLLSGRHTADLTDLIALPALALTRFVWRPAHHIPLALPIAAFACVATSTFSCPDRRYPMDGAEIDPNEPLVMSFGFDSPPADHPALARNVRLIDENGAEVDLIFADGIHVCPAGGLQPNATYTWVIDPLQTPGANSTDIWFNDMGTTTFTTRATSEREPITGVRGCERATILGEFNRCDTAEFRETGFPDTADN